MTKRIATLSLLLLFTATIAFAHAGEEHTYLGTVTKDSADGSFVIKMTNGKDRTVLVSKDTTYTHSDGHKAQRAEVVVGKRVSVRISKDGKTALTVKFSAAKKTTK
jgi:hypothetical protein